MLSELTELRVSESAVSELIKQMESISVNIAKETGELAKHADRATLQAKDIKLAFKNMKRRQ
jgi:histone H3/H4